MLLAVASSSWAQDEPFAKKHLLYRITSEADLTVALVGIENDKKLKEELIVPEEVSYKHDKYAVTSIGKEAFRDREILTTVIVPSIKSVEPNAFKGCTNLTTVTFSDRKERSPNVRP